MNACNSNLFNRTSRAATADVTILLAVKTLVWLDHPTGHLRFGNNNVAACIRGDQSIYMLIVRVPPFNFPGLLLTMAAKPATTFEVHHQSLDAAAEVSWTPFVMPVARPSVEDDALLCARPWNGCVVVADSDAKRSAADICVGQKEVGVQLFESHALLLHRAAPLMPGLLVLHGAQHKRSRAFQSRFSRHGCIFG